MAFRGAKPKADRSQIRHKNPVLEWTEIPDVPHDGPELPQRWALRGGLEVEIAWPVPTIRWWGKIRTMPHAKLWSATDWEFAFSSAELHARIVEGRGSLTELRQREKIMLCTLEARQGSRIRYVAPSAASRREADPVEGDPPPVRLDDFRDLYGAVS